MGLLDLDYEKLAGNPLLNAGLGILANNTGNYGQFAPAFGRGTMQGMQNVQAFNQAQQEDLLRKQQLQAQQEKFDMQKAQFNKQNEQQVKIDAWRSTYGQPNVNGNFDQNTWLQSGIGSGAIDPLQYISAQSKNDDKYSMNKGYVINEKTGKVDKIEGYTGDDSGGGTNDIKNYEYAVKNGFKGSMIDFMRVKPQAMMPIQMANLGIAQENLGLKQRESDYSLPSVKKPSSAGFSISAGGKTYSFKDQKSLNNFKIKAGLR